MSGQKGFSFVQVLVTVGIMGILISALISMMTLQSREMAAMEQKMAALELEGVLISSLLNSSVCNYVLNEPTPLTFDSTNFPARINLPSDRSIPASVSNGPPYIPGPVIAKVGGAASAISRALEVQSIGLEVKSGSQGSYVADWVVDFDQSKLVYPLKPVRIATALVVDDSVPGNSRVSGCGASGETMTTLVVRSTASSCGGGRPNCPTPSEEVSVACPAGYAVTGCGYKSAWNPIANGDGDQYHSNSPNTNHASGNSCVVLAGFAPGCGVCFQVQASCVKFQ